MSRSIPSDPGLPGARGLLGDDGSAALGSFLGSRGWDLEEARPVQAVYRPGRSCLVRYRARATGPDGSRILTLCAETTAEPARVVTPPGDFASRFGLFDPVGRAGEYLVWAYPYDPSLRELPDAAWGPSVRERTGAAAVSVQALRYRPRRRAVFRYRSLHGRRDWRTGFGKVIPSRKAARTVSASARLHAAGLPVKLAARLGRQTLLVPEVQGQSLRRLLLRGASLPSPARLADMVGRMARTRGGEVSWTRPEASATAASAAGLIVALMPELEHDVARVREAAEGGSAPAPQLVHGDLYEAQVLVGPGYSLALIDLDDVSLGDPAMDAANACAHLLVLALTVPAAAERLIAYRQLARTAFQGRLGVTAGELAWREALCVLQLASGPFRVLDPRWPEQVEQRVKLAVRLLDGL
jgi:Phosphotransferase enzyme family